MNSRNDLSSFLQEIRNNVLFDSVDETLVQDVFSSLDVVTLRDGEVIFDDDSEGDCLYLVLAGRVKIAKRTKTGKELVLGVLHEDDFFGELDLIDERRRSARATGIGECRLVRLPRQQFDRLIQASPQFVLNLVRMLSLRLRTSNLTYIRHEEQSLVEINRQLDKLHNLIEASKIVNSSLDLDRLLELILQTAVKSVNADRGTVYLIDDAKNEIWSKVQQGSTVVEIRLPIGRGIAGTVAASGVTINLTDAYSDPRFNPDIDRLTGYRTTTILCMPMRNREGKIVGVFQLLNKLGGDSFTKQDEEFIEGLSVHASIAVENAQLVQQMVQSERLSAVGRMASTIIHDIKNPMSSLRLAAQVMQRRAGREDTARLADEMVHEIDRFITMAQEVLDYARGVSSMNVQEVDFSETMRSMTEFIDRTLTRRNVRLVTNLEFTGTIRIDPEKILRVFYNIAGNAADAMPNGGTLTVHTYRRDRQAVVEFIDTGCGMPPEIKAKIFQPFVTYGKKHGTGLGMSIVKKIIDDHKGSIEVESEVGKGTTIRLLLPVQ